MKSVNYLNQSSLSAIPVSRIHRRSVSSVEKQGHHFRKIGESKTERIFLYRWCMLDAEKRQQNTNVFIKNKRIYDSLAISYADHRPQSGRGGEGGWKWTTRGANCERWTFRSV